MEKYEETSINIHIFKTFYAFFPHIYVYGEEADLSYSFI